MRIKHLRSTIACLLIAATAAFVQPAAAQGKKSRINCGVIDSKNRCASMEAAVCFIENFQECADAAIERRINTVEGDPVTIHAAILGDEGNDCRIGVVENTTFDRWARDPSVTRTECLSLGAQQEDGDWKLFVSRCMDPHAGRKFLLWRYRADQKWRLFLPKGKGIEPCPIEQGQAKE